MKPKIWFIWFIGLMAIPLVVEAQEISPFDGRHWGVVLEHPDTKKVVVKEQIPFYTEAGRTLRMDVYLPPAIQSGEKRPVVVLLNGIGDQPGQPPLKSGPSYTSWSRLLAANGYVTITMESEVNNPQRSIAALFRFLSDNASQYDLDINRIGVQAFSANCREVIAYLMSKDAFAGIKAAVLYYGESPPGPYRPDLPVLFVVAELDIRGDNYSKLWNETLKNFSPWTITIGKGMPHAFDAFSDTDTSRRLIMSTISFWNNQLGSVPPSTLQPSKEREIIASRYDRDQSRMLRLMHEWMGEHPDTQDGYALSMYAQALLENNQFAESGKYLEKSIVMDPKNKGNYLNMALVNYALGKPEEAASNLASYEKGSTPEGFTYWYIANRLIGIGKFNEGAMLYERALKFPNQPPFVYYNLGGCYAMLGHKDKAFQSLFKAAEMKFGTKATYESDANFVSLKSDVRWSELMKKVVTDSN